MAKQMKSSVPLIMFLVLSSIFFATKARRLMNASKAMSPPIYHLSIDAVKAGPSPGAGHKFVNDNTLGGIKDSGPSPGEGHKFIDAETQDRIKDFGPSSEGEGHSFTNPETHDVVKESGPSPGGGH